MCPESRQDLKFVFGEHEPGLSPEAIARQSQRKFVRDNDQISVYDPERNPTGHVLTALEAYETFSLDILAEAVEYNSAVILLRVGAIESALTLRRVELGTVGQVCGPCCSTVVRRHRASRNERERTPQSSRSNVPPSLWAWMSGFWFTNLLQARMRSWRSGSRHSRQTAVLAILD